MPNKKKCLGKSLLQRAYSLNNPDRLKEKQQTSETCKPEVRM